MQNLFEIDQLNNKFILDLVFGLEIGSASKAPAQNQTNITNFSSKAKNYQME